MRIKANRTKLARNLQQFQNKVLRSIVICNFLHHKKDLHILSAIEMIRNYSVKYSDQINAHSNSLAKQLFDNSDKVCRLKRFKTDRFR